MSPTERNFAVNMDIFKKTVSIILRIGVSLALLFFLFRRIDSRGLLEAIRYSNKCFILLAFLLLFFNYVFCLLRWQMLLKALKIHLSLKRVIISFSGGTFFNLLLPSSIGGDVARSVDLATHTKRPREVVATVFLDRLSGYLGLVALVLAAMLFGGGFVRIKSVLFSVSVIVGVLAVTLTVLFNKRVYALVNKLLDSPNSGKIREALRSLHQEIHFFRHHKRVIINNILMSVLIQAITPVTFYLTALALGFKTNVLYFFIFLPIITAITMIPISIGGLGLRDTVTVFFFAQVGLARDLAFAMSLINFFFILVYGIIGGLIYVLTVHHRRLQHHQPPGI